MNSLGVHLLVECFDCDPLILDNYEKIKEAMLESARVAGATIVASAFHRFAPQGVSGAVVVAESHLSIHTWPEYGYAAVDMFTCGEETDPRKGMEFLGNLLGARRVQIQEIRRGLVPLKTAV